MDWREPLQPYSAEVIRLLQEIWIFRAPAPVAEAVLRQATTASFNTTMAALPSAALPLFSGMVCRLCLGLGTPCSVPNSKAPVGVCLRERFTQKARRP